MAANCDRCGRTGNHRGCRLHRQRAPVWLKYVNHLLPLVEFRGRPQWRGRSGADRAGRRPNAASGRHFHASAPIHANRLAHANADRHADTGVPGGSRINRDLEPAGRAGYSLRHCRPGAGRAAIPHHRSQRGRRLVADLLPGGREQRELDQRRLRAEQPAGFEPACRPGSADAVANSDN